ncbi:MAG TPA: hypothetical protein PKI19_03420 [Elusimicrobiales bacterium]|nr:hypothetical protein [Elusimicrobiales bacterium]
MHNRIKRLEELINDAAAAIQLLKEEKKILEEEKEVLRGQVEMLGAARGKAAANTLAARELADFKIKVRRKLERICAKIERINTRQPGLFGEEDEQ